MPSDRHNDVGGIGRRVSLVLIQIFIYSTNAQAFGSMPLYKVTDFFGIKIYIVFCGTPNNLTYLCLGV